MLNKENLIGSYSLSNIASLNIYDINDGEEYVIAGINNNSKRKYKLYFNNKGAYFNWGKHRYYLHEFIRLN